jgi:(S)-3,5-dihydroxyphenylglycine transaminase
VLHSFQASVMNFLNEVASRYPSAISLAAGRPANELFDKLDHQALSRTFLRYENHLAPELYKPSAGVCLFQYGRTAGMINELIARQISLDEGVVAAPERIIVTAGCQEGLALCLPELCPEPADVVMVCNPTYIGVSGAANATRVGIFTLPGDGVDLAEEIEKAVLQLQGESRRARALYLIPDFDNPTGRVIDLAQRHAILEACSKHRIVILEDNPYGMFRYEGSTVPPLAALDQEGSVIYLSTYSKTVSPALRVGAVTLPETLFGDKAARKGLFESIVQRKSFITVNTSQISQAIIGGLLLEQGGSLREWVRPTLEVYRRNRDAMLTTLGGVFTPYSNAISWNRPEGGFFLCMELPFSFDARAVTECAEKYGVIVMPMSFFAFDHSQNNRIRLAFSAVDAGAIEAAIAALGSYISRKTSSLGAR